MQLPALHDLVSVTGKLATLPETVIRLLSILSDPHAPASRVQEVLERDPAMTANVLKISNSAFYGARRRIASVRDALVMLGNRRTATLAFATGMAPVMRQDLLSYGIGREQFWRQALMSAAAAAQVAARTGRQDLQCEAFTAGLVHDVGMLILDPVLAAAGFSLETEGPLYGTSRQEVAVLGYDHCQAGALLAEGWGFPEVLTRPVRFHHLPDLEAGILESSPLVRPVAAGCLLAQALTPDLHGECQDEIAQCLIDLGLPEDLLEQLRLDLTENLGETCHLATSTAASAGLAPVPA